KLPLGTHKLKVVAPGYDAFESDVQVNFQKVSPVVVRLLQSGETSGTGALVRREREPFYTKPWFIGVAAVGAIVVAGVIGWQAGKITTCTYDEMGGRMCD